MATTCAGQAAYCEASARHWKQWEYHSKINRHMWKNVSVVHSGVRSGAEIATSCTKSPRLLPLRAAAVAQVTHFAVVPSTRVVAIKGKQAEYGRQHFVASTASLVGQVKLGELSSTWYGATVKGQ
jgi:hypothetical protein